MNLLAFAIDARAIEILGWALVHFLWHGALLALALAGMLRFFRRSPQVGYALSTAVLALMAACPPATIVWLSRGTATAAAATKAPAPASTASVPTDGPGRDSALIAPVTPPIDMAMTERESTGYVPHPETAKANARSSWTALTFLSLDRVQMAIAPWLPWLVAGWVLGVALFSSRLCLVWTRIRNIARSHRPAAADWQAALVRIAHRLGVARPVMLVESALVDAPTVIGWLRPIVLLPASALMGLAPAQVEALLAHELAHIRRHDYLVNLLQCGVEALLFYHPAVWWVSARMRAMREHCCDDIAAAACGSTLDYARTLARLEEQRHLPVRLGVAASGGSLLERIRRLASRPEAAHSIGGVPAIPLFLAIVLAISAYAALARSAGEERPRNKDAAIDDVETGVTASTEGRLIDANGEPVGDALVWLAVQEWGMVSADGPPVISQGKSSNDGRFELTPLASDVDRFVKSERTEFQIWVRKAGLALTCQATKGSLPSEPVEIKLENESRDEFRLRNPDRTPCAGATVTPHTMKFAGHSYQIIPEVIRRHLKVHSDADGRFTLFVPRENIVELEFETEKLGRQQYGFHVQGRRIPTEFTLRNTGTIKGRLVLPAGARVDLSAVKIRVGTLESTEHGLDEARYGAANVRPDRDGRFAIPAIAEGTIRAFIEEPEGLGHCYDPPAEEPRLKAGTTANIEFPMSRAARITRLLRERGTQQPIPSVHVRMQHRTQIVHARTDRSGRFAAWILPDVPYQTNYDLPDEFIIPNEFANRAVGMIGQTRVSAGSEELEPLELPRGRTLEGVVIDSRGEPLADVRVGANWHDSGPRAVVKGAGAAVDARKWATTDSAGHFRIRGLPPDAEITLTPMRAQVVLGKSVELGADDGRIRLQTDNFEFTSFTGRVVDQDGVAIAGADLVVQLNRDENIFMAMQLVSDANGRFRTPAHFPKQFDYRLVVRSKRENIAAAPW
ncbi:MAG TPA: M56 family metallopeptidase, partial [Planctomycetaceae bacterium]|nr:M56 family metallopeptidase [Planctomycetaceae bacterium]